MFSFTRKKRWSYDLTSVDETEKEAETPETKEAHEPRRSLNIRASFKYFGLNEKKKDKNHDKSTTKDAQQKTDEDSKTTEDKTDGSDLEELDRNSETEFLKCGSSTEETSEDPSEIKEKEEENLLDESQNEAEIRNNCSEAKLKKRPSFLEEVLAETASLNLSGKEVDENQN